MNKKKSLLIATGFCLVLIVAIITYAFPYLTTPIDEYNSIGNRLLSLWIFVIPLFIVSFIIWIYALVHAIQNKFLSDSERVCWVLAIIFTNLIGALLYIFIGAKETRS